jgi:hypothetical protein
VTQPQRRLFIALAMAVAASGALTALAADRAPEPPEAWSPRFTLVEGQYPQGVDISGGAWAFLPTTRSFDPGIVGDVELGLSGAAIDLGVGMARHRGSVEHSIAFGLEGTAMRSWPGWSLALATNETLVGARAFASYFAYRCSIGSLWTVEGARAGHVVPFIGCGIGVL